jgi:hypothetical protein
MAKIVCVLYDDPVYGYPTSYARDDIPTLERYPDGQTLPTPRGVAFNPGELLGSVSGELGLRRFLEEQDHTLIVTSDKDGADSVFERELVDADIVISQPFLARVPDGRADREGAETEARDHSGGWLRPRRSPGCDRSRHHRHRGDVLQQHQCR